MFRSKGFGLLKLIPLMSGQPNLAYKFIHPAIASHGHRCHRRSVDYRQRYKTCPGSAGGRTLSAPQTKNWLVLSEELLLVKCRPVLTWRPFLGHVQQQTGAETEMQVKARIKQYYWCQDWKHLIDAVGIMAEEELPGVLILDVGGTHGVLEDLAALLKKHFRLITMKEFLENKKEMSKKIQSVFVFECRPTIDRELLESLPNLKVIGNSGVGVDHLDLKMISNFGVKVTNTPHAVADPTADIGVALMLASARRLVEGCQITVSPDTKYFAVDWLGVEVTRATLGIIGMGSIGYKVAQRARAFNMRILYHNRNRRRKEEEEAVCAHYCEKMEDLLQQSDFVMLVVNLTPETHKLIGKKELGLMKPTATLINISRGAVIDQDALVEALQNKVIRAAALDVTYPEPLPRDHPLLKLNNIIITPHIGTATVQAIRMMAEEAIANMLAVLNGQPIPSEVFPK